MPDFQNKTYLGGGLNKNPQRPGQTGGQSRERNDLLRSTRGDNQSPAGGQNREREELPRPAKGDYNKQWITDVADATLVEYAEKAGRYMARRGLTNSKIRSIYGEIKRIQMSEFDKEKSAFILLKPKVAYALGREPGNDGLRLFREIFDLSSVDVTNQKSFQNFCNLMEAILAYHKAWGGKD